MMLAYVRSGAPTQDELIAYLKNGGVEYNVVDVIHGSPPDGDEVLLRSVHERPWQYPSAANPPGPIELTHIWLSLS